MTVTPPSLPPGTSPLPPGHIAAVVTYLEMTAKPRPKPSPLRTGPLALRRFAGDVDAYRALFRRVGQEWLWVSRLILDDAALGAILADPDVEVQVLHHRDAAIGLLELDFRQPGECELTFCGIVPEAIGQGFGRFLMGEAVARAWAKPIRRFWVHTCSHDHPSAVRFYQQSGFRAYAMGVDVFEDPRLSGVFPADVAPHVPMIGRPPGAPQPRS